MATIIGTLPNIIADGQAADAVPVMADFNFIVSQVNTNGAPQSTTPTIAQIQAGNFTFLTSVAGSDTITASAVPALTSYSAGSVFTLVAAGTNATSSPTLNINGLGAKNLVALAGASLSPGAIPSGGMIIAGYDGTQFQVIGFRPSRKNQIINTQNFSDSGSATTSTSLVNLQGMSFGYTPVSTNSYLNMVWTFQAAVNSTASGNEATYQPFETTSGTVAIGPGYVAGANTANVAFNASQTVVVSSLSNTVLTARLFNLFGATNSASASISATSIRCTIQEISNV